MILSAGIDRFAEVRGIYARISTPLQRLQQLLQDRLDELTPANPLEKALVALMRQSRRLFVDNTPSAAGPGGVWRLNTELGKSLASQAEKGLAFVVKSAVGDASKTGLKAVSGSSLHEAVKKVGEFVGYKFKAWEAVKIADTLGKGAKFLGPVMAVAGLGLQLLDDHQQGKMRKQVLEARRSIRREFLEFAQAMSRQLKVEESKYLEAAYDKPMEAIDQALDEIQQQAKNKTEQTEAFVECLEEIGSLRREIMDLMPA